MSISITPVLLTREQFTRELEDSFDNIVEERVPNLTRKARKAVAALKQKSVKRMFQLFDWTTIESEPRLQQQVLLQFSEGVVDALEDAIAEGGR